MARESLDMLPPGYEGERWGADLHLTPDGRFLYTSERASSLLTLFGVSPKMAPSPPRPLPDRGLSPGLCHRPQRPLAHRDRAAIP